MQDNSTQNRYDIAEELGIPNEVIGQVRQIDDCIYFVVNGCEYSARLTKNGKLKKHSVRKD